MEVVFCFSFNFNVTKCCGITVQFSFAHIALCTLFFAVHLAWIFFLRWCRMRFNSVHLGSKCFPANSLAKKKNENRSQSALNK